jgi:hypothetical protein
VQAAEFGDGGVHRRLDVRAVGHVGRDGYRPAALLADRRGCLLCGLLVEVNDRDRRAVGGEPPGYRRTDSLSAAGHQRDPLPHSPTCPGSLPCRPLSRRPGHRVDERSLGRLEVSDVQARCLLAGEVAAAA